jgi:hypothetical protein
MIVGPRHLHQETPGEPIVKAVTEFHGMLWSLCLHDTKVITVPLILVGIRLEPSP